MPLTRSSARRATNLTIDPSLPIPSTTPRRPSDSSSTAVFQPDPTESAPPTPPSTPSPTHCGCPCHRSDPPTSLTIFSSYSCGLNLSLSRTRESVADLIHDCVRKAFNRDTSPAALLNVETGARIRPFEARKKLQESADEVMKVVVKEALSPLANELRGSMMEKAEEQILQDWGLMLRDDAQKQKESQQAVANGDVAMSSPGLSQSLDDVSLASPAEGTPISKIVQGRRDSPVVNRQPPESKPKASAKEAAEGLETISEESETEQAEVIDSKKRKSLKRKQSGIFEKGEEEGSAKISKSKKTRFD